MKGISINYQGVFCSIVFSVFVLTAKAQDPLISKSSTIPWNASEEAYHKSLFKMKEKQQLAIKGINFDKSYTFIENKGLSEITYLANLNDEPFAAKCKVIQDAISDVYGQRTNEVHVTDQGKLNYSETIWTSKLDRVVRLFCYHNSDENRITVSIYPRWLVLDCTLHAEDVVKKKKKKRAFFYFDKNSEQIRFFNNSEVTLPFQSNFQNMRISFDHNNIGDHTTIDLDTGVIMSRFIDEHGQEQLLAGKCKKE